MVNQEPDLAQVFDEHPLLAYKKQRNIRGNNIIAKVPPPMEQYPKRQLNGMKKCDKGCVIYPFVEEAKHVKSNHFKVKIATPNI